MLRSVPGYEGLYAVNTAGTVISYVVDPSGRALKPAVNSDGYYHVNLYKDYIPRTFYIHQIVAEVFLTKGNNATEICHCDGNKLNNDVSNLRWDTSRENKLDVVRHGDHHNANKEYCKRGAKLEPPNLMPGKGRQCLACNRTQSAKRYLRESKGMVMSEREFQDLHDKKLREIFE